MPRGSFFYLIFYNALFDFSNGFLIIPVGRAPPVAPGSWRAAFRVATSIAIFHSFLSEYLFIPVFPILPGRPANCTKELSFPPNLLCILTNDFFHFCIDILGPICYTIIVPREGAPNPRDTVSSDNFLRGFSIRGSQRKKT